MTWLIVGGTGQLGNALSAVLKERKINFIAWGSKDLDIRSAKETIRVVGHLKPSVIINSAAWTDVDGAESDVEGAHALNVDGARNLALAAKVAGATFVQISTDYVFSGIGLTPWREDDVREPTSVYGKSKAAGEDAVLSNYSEGTYVFRTAWLYSKWGKNFVKTMVRLALESKDEIQVVYDQVGQPTFAIDLANKIVDSVTMKIPFGTYHVTNSGQASWCEFAQEILKIIDEDSSRIIPISSSEFQRPAQRPKYSILSNEIWKNIRIFPMQEWKIALQGAMPSIISAVKEEQ